MTDPWFAKQMLDRLRDELREMTFPDARGGEISLFEVFERSVNAIEVSVDHWAETRERVSCPDGGKCHHGCGRDCWRESNCGPLSGVYPEDRWPTRSWSYWVENGIGG